MSDAEILAEAVRRIDAYCHPRQVLLFGSRARGEAQVDSDFDLAVVVDGEPDSWRIAGDLRGELGGLPASFDIVVFATTAWQKWRTVPVAFEHRIAREGRVLLDAA